MYSCRDTPIHSFGKEGSKCWKPGIADHFSFTSLSLSFSPGSWATHKKQIGQGQKVSGEQDLSNENATKQSGGVTCMKPIMVVTGTKSFSLSWEFSLGHEEAKTEADHHCIWHSESEEKGRDSWPPVCVCYEVRRIYDGKRVIIMVYMHGTHSIGEGKERDTKAW